jgi:hypothetical protein
MSLSRSRAPSSFERVFSDYVSGPVRPTAGRAIKPAIHSDGLARPFPGFHVPQPVPQPRPRKRITSLLVTVGSFFTRPYATRFRVRA